MVVRKLPVWLSSYLKLMMVRSSFVRNLPVCWPVWPCVTFTSRVARCRPVAYFSSHRSLVPILSSSVPYRSLVSSRCTVPVFLPAQGTTSFSTLTTRLPPQPTTFPHFYTLHSTPGVIVLISLSSHTSQLCSVDIDLACLWHTNKLSTRLVTFT